MAINYGKGKNDLDYDLEFWSNLVNFYNNLNNFFLISQMVFLFYVVLRVLRKGSQRL